MKKIGVVLLLLCLLVFCSACKTDKKSKNTVSKQTTANPQETDVIEAPGSEENVPVLDFETGKIIENTSGSSLVSGSSFEEAGSSTSSVSESSTVSSSASSNSASGIESSTVSSSTQSTASSSGEGMTGWEPFS